MSRSVVGWRAGFDGFGRDFYSFPSELTNLAQFEAPEPEIPVKTIAYAVVLFLVGTLLLVFGSLLFTGVIENNVRVQRFVGRFPPASSAHLLTKLTASLIVDQYSDRWASMIVLGSLMFIPGSYHTFLAYKAWQGAPGYSFNDVPDFTQ